MRFFCTCFQTTEMDQTSISLWRQNRCFFPTVFSHSVCSLNRVSFSTAPLVIRVPVALQLGIPGFSRLRVAQIQKHTGTCICSTCKVDHMHVVRIQSWATKWKTQIHDFLIPIWIMHADTQRWATRWIKTQIDDFWIPTGTYICLYQGSIRVPPHDFTPGSAAMQLHELILRNNGGIALSWPVDRV